MRVCKNQELPSYPEEGYAILDDQHFQRGLVLRADCTTERKGNGMEHFKGKSKNGGMAPLESSQLYKQLLAAPKANTIIEDGVTKLAIKVKDMLLVRESDMHIKRLEARDPENKKATKE